MYISLGILTGQLLDGRGIVEAFGVGMSVLSLALYGMGRDRRKRMETNIRPGYVMQEGLTAGSRRKHVPRPYFSSTQPVGSSGISEI